MSKKHTKLKPTNGKGRKWRKEERAAKTYWNNYFGSLRKSLYANSKPYLCVYAGEPSPPEPTLAEMAKATMDTIENPVAKRIWKDLDDATIAALKKNNPHLIKPIPSGERAIDGATYDWMKNDEAGQVSERSYKDGPNWKLGPIPDSPRKIIRFDDEPAMTPTEQP